MLDERGETGQSHLQRLFFYDGAEARGCRVPGVLAFTQPGSHVVYVCSQWFREAFATNPSKVEAVIIHESLHSLGLGENPPRARRSQPGSWSAAFVERGRRQGQMARRAEKPRDGDHHLAMGGVATTSSHSPSAPRRPAARA